MFWSVPIEKVVSWQTLLEGFRCDLDMNFCSHKLIMATQTFALSQMDLVKVIKLIIHILVKGTGP